MRTLHNPILPGFYPDPSICRVGDDYYLVTSTFTSFPGVPIFHSKDLVNWRQIGHVLTRPSQLNLDQCVSARQGIYAPTIRYHDGTFYMITTNVMAGERNFIVTATDPAGPWSDPYWLEDAVGIDPSLLFDGDKVYYTGNQLISSLEEGHTEIWLRELDLKTMKLVGPKVSIWDGMCGGTWVEGAHLYKIGGWYYLTSAEGGTGHSHAVMIARSKSPTGPFEGYANNPLLTHRHLGLDYPIVNVGHADLVETQNGEWWMVALASRPYGGYYRNLGRETFLMPVRWEDDWPVISPGSGRVEAAYPAPNLPEHPWPIPPLCDNFESTNLDHRWNFIGTPREPFWSLSERPGCLRLRLRPQKIEVVGNPGFVGRRLQHFSFAGRTVMEFTPQNAHEAAGIVLYQTNDFLFQFVYTRTAEGQTVLRLIKRASGSDEILAEKIVSAGRLYLKVEAVEQDYSFYFAANAEQWEPLFEHADGRILSTDAADSFMGAYIGLYATSNGRESSSVADFDWFEYRPASDNSF